MEFFSNAIQKAQASVDQALGIDATIADEAMELSKTEGDVLSMIAGKDSVARLSEISETTKRLAEETTKKLAQTSKKVVEHVKEAQEKVGIQGEGQKLKDKERKSNVPKPDDFFLDSADDFPTPSKLKEAKVTKATFEDDFDFFASAKPVSSRKARAALDDSNAETGSAQKNVAGVDGAEPVESTHTGGDRPGLSTGSAAAGDAADGWGDAWTPTPTEKKQSGSHEWANDLQSSSALNEAKIDQDKRVAIDKDKKPDVGPPDAESSESQVTDAEGGGKSDGVLAYGGKRDGGVAHDGADDGADAHDVRHGDSSDGEDDDATLAHHATLPNGEISESGSGGTAARPDEHPPARPDQYPHDEYPHVLVARPDVHLHSDEVDWKEGSTSERTTDSKLVAAPTDNTHASTPSTRRHTQAYTPSTTSSHDLEQQHLSPLQQRRAHEGDCSDSASATAAASIATEQESATQQERATELERDTQSERGTQSEDRQPGGLPVKTQGGGVGVDTAGGSIGGQDRAGVMNRGLEESFRAAMARLARVTEDNAALRVKALELEKAAAQMHEALARKEAARQQSIEKEEHLEVKIEEQKQRILALEGELTAQQQAHAGAVELARKVRELEADKADLYKDGQRVMEEQGVLKKTIKNLRQELKDRDKAKEGVVDSLLTEQARIKGYEERYVMATEQMEKAKAAMEAAKAESKRKDKILDDRDKEWTALQKRLSGLEKTLELLASERDTLAQKLQQVTDETQEDAKRALERDRKHMEQDAAERIEMLTDSLETMQAALRRHETQSSFKEQRYREEIDDLSLRCRQAEERSQDLSSSVPQATRPLLRQIESLQTGAAEKQRVWEQLEQQLRHRCSEAEAEARAAAQRETIASERLSHQQEGVAAAELRILSLQAEVSRLAAEQRGAKEEVNAAERAEKDVTAELVVARAALERRAQEMAELKATHKQQAEEEAVRAQQERDRLYDDKAALARQVRALEGSLSALKEAAARGDTHGSGSTLATNTFSNLHTLGSPKFFDLSNFPVSNKSDPLDAFSIESSKRDLHLGDRGRDRDRDVSVSLSDILASSHTHPWQTENTERQIAALHQRVSALEGERDALADELAAVVTSRNKAQSEAATLPHLLKELAGLGQQYQLTLELLGATEEEVDDMRMTLDEARLIYRSELERLMDVMPQDHRWNLPSFPTTVLARTVVANAKEKEACGAGGPHDVQPQSF